MTESFARVEIKYLLPLAQAEALEAGLRQRGFTRSDYGSPRAQDGRRELRISVPESLDCDGLFDDLLEAAFVSWDLIRVRTAEMGTVYQLIYRGVLREGQDGRRFLDAVRERNGNLPVSLGHVEDTRDGM